MYLYGYLSEFNEDTRQVKQSAYKCFYVGKFWAINDI